MRQAVAVQVVDQPAARRLRLHEAQEGDQLGMIHVVRDQARGHDVPAFARAIGIVAGAEADRQQRIGRGAGDLAPSAG